MLDSRLTAVKRNIRHARHGFEHFPKVECFASKSILVLNYTEEMKRHRCLE